MCYLYDEHFVILFQIYSDFGWLDIHDIMTQYFALKLEIIIKIIIKAYCKHINTN